MRLRTAPRDHRQNGSNSACQDLISASNTYLRLAQTIHPLLFTPFGDDENCLYILPELNDELESRRLQSKFPWVDDAEYADNRKHFPTIGRKQRKAIQQAFGYIWDFVQSNLPGPSQVDALYIAYAQELDIPVVTDDQDMTALAREFEVEVMSTLELLKLMLDCGHVDMQKIKSIRGYLQHIKDLPANFNSDYKRLFLNPDIA